MKKLLTLALAATFVTSCLGPGEKYYEKHVVIPEGATEAEIVDIAARVVPTRNQLAWQQMELTAFLHYGINTYTNREWGDYKNYAVCLNTAQVDEDTCVDLIVNLFNK